MSLDLGFFRQDESEALYFRNHWDLLDMFAAEPLVFPYPDSPNDFYVTRPLLAAVIAKIEAEMDENNLPIILHDSPEFAELENAVPENFTCAEPDDWVGALPHYRVLLYRLLADVRADGCLICGWNA